MTAAVAPLQVRLIAAGVLAAGTAALAGRVVAPGSVLVLVAVGAAALLAPVPHDPTPAAMAPHLVFLAGAVGVAVAAAAAPAPPVPFWWWGATAAVLAAVAEEAFFRRLMYGWLSRWGAGWAVGIGAVAFALVHVGAYGWWIVPLDLAIGLVFGWQRWASGTWTVPAATHAAANLMLMTG
ncbi:MAG TPA: CPBP family glutamic-type intramembrane protease [Actinomycetota bacterium]|nr:CPBP family glutamic-type intramembrane protease [Actinomycetota bacterium]